MNPQLSIESKLIYSQHNKFIREIETVINLLIYLVNEENVNLNDIEILTLFVAQQYFLKKEIMAIIKVFH